MKDKKYSQKLYHKQTFKKNGSTATIKSGQFIIDNL